MRFPFVVGSVEHVIFFPLISTSCC